MIRALYTATSGMLVRGTDQFDMLANNLANVGTPGFKAQYLHQISQPVKGPATPTDVQVSYTERYEDPAVGQTQFTGEDLDLAIEGGDAFFTVALPDGRTAYTRNGHLRRTAQGFLLDAGGNRILGAAGPLAVPPDTRKILVDASGNLTADGVPAGKLRLAQFDPAGKAPKPLGGSLFVADERNPAKPANADITLSQGYFQRSNVNVVQEMIRLIEAVRSMEAYQKIAIAASDETTGQLVRQTGRVA